MDPSAFIPDAGRSLSDLAGRRLLIACVTIGNVPQLAADLLLSSGGGATRLGRLRSPALLPFAGLSASGEITTGAEIHLLPGGSAVLQHRSPPARGRASEHAAFIASFAAGAGVSEVILLASANAAGRQDAHLSRQGGPFAGVRFALAAGVRPTAADAATAAGIKPLEGCDADGVWQEAGADIPFLPLARPSGFVRAAFDGLSGKVPAMLALMFAHEGENSADAAALACVGAHVAGVDVGGKGKVAEEGGLGRFMGCFEVPESWGAVAPPPPGLY